MLPTHSQIIGRKGINTPTPNQLSVLGDVSTFSYHSNSSELYIECHEEKQMAERSSTLGVGSKTNSLFCYRFPIGLSGGTRMMYQAGELWT